MSVKTQTLQDNDKTVVLTLRRRTVVFIAVTACLLTLCAESFVLHLAIQEYIQEYQNIQNYKSLCCFAWV